MGSNTTIPCPICKGTKRNPDPSFGPVCIACRGSGELARTSACTIPAPRVQWDNDEVERLIELRGSGKTWKEVARELGRTIDSAKKRYRRWRLSALLG